MLKVIEKKPVTFRMPESITRSDNFCPDCLIKYYIVNNKEVCGQCELEGAQVKAENKIKNYYNKNGDAIGNYNRGKAEKARERDDKRKDDFKKRQYGDKS